MDSYELDKMIGQETCLDDIPDLPGFIQLHSGAYHVVLEKGIEERDIDDKKYFSVEMTVKEVLQLSEKLEEGERSPAPGDVQSLLFKRDHAVGMGNFKMFVADIAKRFNCTTVGEVIENSKGLELLITGKRTHNKEKDLYNFNPRKVALV